MFAGLLETYLIGRPGDASELAAGIFLSVLIPGLVLAALSLKLGRERRAKLLAGALVLLVSSGVVFFVSDPFEQNSVSVGNGSVLVSAPPYFSLNVTSTQIASAFVVNLSSWNVSITSRTAGTELGSFRSGYFRLSNGASADLLSTGNTNLVLVLKSGVYVILSPENFQSFLSVFAQNVVNAQA